MNMYQFQIPLYENHRKDLLKYDTATTHWFFPDLLPARVRQTNNIKYDTFHHSSFRRLFGRTKKNLLRNVHENVVASAGGLDEAVSFAPAERPHFSLLDGVTHGPVRSGGGGMKKKKENKMK